MKSIHHILAEDNVCSRLLLAFIAKHGRVDITDKPAWIECWHPSSMCLESKRRIMYPKDRRYVSPEAALPTLAHALQHVYQYIQRPYTHSLSYTIPQSLAVLCLFGFLWWPLWMIALLALPWPAYWRARTEAEAYAVTRHALWATRTSVGDYTEKFRSWKYYWMWPFKSMVEGWFAKWDKKPPVVAEMLYKEVM